VYDTIITEVLVASILSEIDGWIDESVPLVEFKMMEKYNADAILSSTTKAMTTPQGTLAVIVRGYPVKYTNFRLAKSTDAWMVDFYRVIDKNMQETGTGTVTVKSREVINK
jgi:hypothetical protein